MTYHKIQMNSTDIQPSIQNSITIKNALLTTTNSDVFSYPIGNIDDLTFVKFNGQLPYTSIVPHKHGEHSPSGTVFASGYIDDSTAPYRAFTYNTIDKWQITNTIATLGYEFIEDKLLYKYEIACHSLVHINMAPKTWTFEGYNEDTFDWDILDTQTDIVFSTTAHTLTFFVTPSRKYKKYQLNITVTNGSTTNLSINHLKLYEVYDKLDVDNKVRIELDNRTKLYFYKITDGMCNIYQQNSAYEITIPKINSEYYIYFHLNGSGSLVFEAEQIRTIRQNRTDVFPICSVYNNSENKIVSCNKVSKIVYSTIFNVQRVKTPLPTSRGSYLPKSTKKDNIMYVIGGSFTANEGYNVLDDSWTAYTNQPILRVYASCATVYDIFYQFGGNNNTPNAEFYTYNIDLNSWTTQTNMPVARTQHCSDQYNNSKIYLITTYLSAQETPTGEYTILDQTWASKANIPDRHRLATATTYNNSIYCIGGTSLVDATTTNREYNIIGDSWSVKKSTLIENLYNQSANLINNYILCLGSGIAGTSNSNHSYFPLEDIWMDNGSLYTALLSVVSEYINGNIYSVALNKTCTEYVPPSY